MASVSTPAAIESPLELAEKGLTADEDSQSRSIVRRRQPPAKNTKKRPATQPRKVTKAQKKPAKRSKPATAALRKRAVATATAAATKKRRKQLRLSNARKLPWL